MNCTVSTQGRYCIIKATSIATGDAVTLEKFVYDHEEITVRDLKQFCRRNFANYISHEWDNEDCIMEGECN